MSVRICGCCKRKVEVLTPRYVAVKKAVLDICGTCEHSYVTYDPSEFIPEGDSQITCNK